MKLNLDSEGPVTILAFGKDHEHDLYEAQHGRQMLSVLWDLQNWMRRKVNKGEHSFKTADEALEATWDEFHALLADNDVNLDVGN